MSSVHSSDCPLLWHSGNRNVLDSLVRLANDHGLDMSTCYEVLLLELLEGAVAEQV